MMVPLAAGQTLHSSKELARSLSRLPLTSLLNHTGGVEVGESIIHGIDGQWKRIYRIRLKFEDPVKIQQTFGVDFQVRSGENIQMGRRHDMRGTKRKKKVDE